MTCEGPLGVYKYNKIIIPKICRSDMISKQHHFHYSVEAMIATAGRCVWWPNINSQLTDKWATCLRCQ